MTMKCPNCGNEIEIPEGVVEGQHVQCPHCGAKFEFHAPQQNIDFAKSLWKRHGIRFLSILCGVIAAHQFLSGWFELPIKYSYFFFSPIHVSHFDYNTEILLECLAKMFAGFFFAKVSLAFWRMKK